VNAEDFIVRYINRVFIAALVVAVLSATTEKLAGRTASEAVCIAASLLASVWIWFLGRKTNTVEIPVDAYDVFTWRHPAPMPAEACAKDGVYCWCGRGLVYLGPIAPPPTPDDDAADMGRL
jgi:hypothetical protein